MPPRRSARVAAAEAQASLAFPLLPPAVTLRIFALLPADERARCAAVSRGWRDTLRAPELWRKIDLSPSSAVPPARRTAAAMLALATRAAGGLLSLDVSGVLSPAYATGSLLAVKGVPCATLARFISRHAPALQELTLVRDLVDDPLSPAQARALLAACPALRSARLAVHTTEAESHADVACLLRREAPYERVRLVEVLVHHPENPAALVEDSVAHPELELLRFSGAALGQPGAMEACVAAMLQRKVWRLGFSSCGLSPASAPALARLIREGQCTELGIYVEHGAGLLDEAAAAELGAALRANRTLTSIKFACLGLWRQPGAGAALLAALVGHPTLREIGLWSNDVAPQFATVAGDAIAALVAADAPALKELRVGSCALGNEGLAPVFQALRRNRHLEIFDCRGSNESAAFHANVMLPAVRANTGLRRLTSNFGDAVAEVRRRGSEGHGSRRRSLPVLGHNWPFAWAAELGLEHAEPEESEDD